VVTYIDPYTGEEKIKTDGPSIADIAIARNNLIQAQETVKEDQTYLEVLQTGVIPDDATGEKLTTLYEAQQAIEDAQDALEETKLLAPISGTVTALDLNAGEQMNKEAASIITISRLDQPYTVDAYLDEADWNMAQIGNKVNVTFDLLPDQTFPGTVTLVYPVLSESWEASLVHITVQLDQRLSQDLPTGTGADVEVIGGEAKDVVLVSVDAIHKTDDGKSMATVIQNGQQVEREVEIGLQNDTNAEIISGLTAGEVVVTK
jgi:HlyD family secretion protein